MTDICERLATSGRLLVRSGIEIERILASMVDDRDAVTASLPDDRVFVSRLVCVDPDLQEVFVAPSDQRSANTAVLASPALTLRCQHRGAQFSFSCLHPRPGRLSDTVAIRVSTPRIVLAAQPRHDWPRAKLPLREPDVRCELRMGLISFGARLVDMGLDGKAFIVSEPGIPVCEGTRLKGARFRNWDGETMRVDVDVEKVIQAVLPDGKRATRIGCRILAPRETLEKMIRLFIVDLW